MLGVALVFGNERLFEDFRDVIKIPCEADFATASNFRNVKEVGKLLEITLLCAFVNQNFALADQVLQLGTKLSYLVGVTKELCKYVLTVNSTDATEEYKFWSMLI